MPLAGLFEANAGPATWLLWDGRRSPVDLADRTVTSALGIGVDIPAAQSISPGLFNAIPESAALTTPVIPGAGAPPEFPLPVPAPIGAVATLRPALKKA